MSAANDDENIYEGHPALTPVQAQVLNEYAKLNRSLKSVTALTAEINEARNDELVAQLRALERQMGLVLTLFKASVWSYYRSQGLTEDDEEDEDDVHPLLQGPSQSGDLLRAARMRENIPPREHNLNSSEGNLTLDITAMPLPDARR